MLLSTGEDDSPAGQQTKKTTMTMMSSPLPRNMWESPTPRDLPQGLSSFDVVYSLFSGLLLATATALPRSGSRAAAMLLRTSGGPIVVRLW